MSWSLIVTPEAEADLDEARAWYEDRRTGLGDDFLDRVAMTLRTIQQMPYLFGTFLREARVALIDRFPYAIVYRIHGDEVAILAVFHVRSDPQAWQGRI